MRSLSVKWLAAYALLAARAGYGQMPAAEQNAIVQKYCAVCHTDAKPTAGLSLQNFDAAHADPGIVSMMRTKMQTGAFSAAGLKTQPDRAAQDALLSAFLTESAAAKSWYVQKVPVVSASIAQQAAGVAKSNVPEVYRLALTCDPATHQGAMQLTWAPRDVPDTGGTFSATVDGSAPVIYPVEMGHASAALAPKTALALPAENITVRDLFAGETVVFPFAGLANDTRTALAACFAQSRAAK